MSSETLLNLGEILGTAGWRQGSILSKETLEHAQKHLPNKIQRRLALGNVCAILVSQDCDIVRHQDTENNIELIFGSWTNTIDNAYTHGRHARKLALRCTKENLCLLLDIRYRAEISKSVLLRTSNSLESINSDSTFRPDSQRIIDSEAVILLANWMSKRYTRPAFPDEFNARIATKAGKKIEKLTKSKLSTHVTAVYLLLNEPYKDLPPEKNYEALFWFACKADVFEENGPALRDVHEFASKYIEAIKSCPGIVTVEGEFGWDVRGEHQITLDDLRELKQYNYDYRSYATKPGGELPCQ